MTGHSAAAGQSPGAPSFPWPLVKGHVSFALLVWAGFVAFVLLVILAVAAVRGIEVSGWDRATEAVRFYAVFIGIHLGYSQLPLHITHGQTRREFAMQAAMFAGVFVTALAAMVAAGFVLERGLYEVAGWPQDVSDGRLYTSPSELHWIFVQGWLVQGLWFVGGALIGAAWYRGAWSAGIALTAAIIVAIVSQMFITSDWTPFMNIYEQAAGSADIQPALATLYNLVLIGGLLAACWYVIRDIPIQNKAA